MILLISWTFHKNDLAVAALNISPTEVLFSIVFRIIASLNRLKPILLVLLFLIL